MTASGLISPLNCHTPGDIIIPVDGNQNSYQFPISYTIPSTVPLPYVKGSGSCVSVPAQGVGASRGLREVKVVVPQRFSSMTWKTIPVNKRIYKPNTRKSYSD